MMERIWYDFSIKTGLNFGKEKQALLSSFAPKETPITTTRSEEDSVM